MKTLKSVVNQDERNAKAVGAIINLFITVAGALTCIYGIVLWAQHSHIFGL